MNSNEQYLKFLDSKKRTFKPVGIDLDESELNPMLFDFQKDIVRWALAKGKSSIFLSTGLGKTFLELEWARHVVKKTGGKVLILAPLAVATQTVKEGLKFGIPVTLCRTWQDVEPGINITNYEMLENFVPEAFDGIVLDESSILKSFTSKTRNQIIEKFRDIKFKLACTATPAPNDYMELGNHAEFVGVMNRTEMLSMFFVHDMKDTAKWRIKKHAEPVFWEWVASWAVMMQRPSDLGYTAQGYDLPELKVEQVTVNDDETSKKLQEIKEAKRKKEMGITLDEQRVLRNSSIVARVRAAADIVNSKKDTQWVVWCDLNDESALLADMIEDAVEVKGSDKPEYKEKTFDGFSNGSVRVLVTKPSIAGFGMNWQNCQNCAFVGLSYSFEAYYQAVRRFWRFGQTKPVNAYVITSSSEGHVVQSIRDKEERFNDMIKGMIASTQKIQKENIIATIREVDQYQTKSINGVNFEAQLGDCCELIKNVASDSVGFSVFSPPFASLYTYSNSERDMGNCTTQDEFNKHFEFLTTELNRVMIPGRLIAVHCMQLPTSKERDGYIGLRDFRGDIIRMFQKAGFIYHSEAVIWKNPVIAMQRTKALGLLHKTIRKDSSMSRQGIPDYLVVFRKKGQNPDPISHTYETFSIDQWQQYASPVWADINPSDTLQYRSARSENDERHICPLQLSVIERAIALWSKPGDLVLSPFMGIGSEGWKAVEMGRKFLGFELKESYFNMAIKNLDDKDKEVSILGPNLDLPKIHVFKGREYYGVKAKTDDADPDEESEESIEESDAS
jgi:DNA modification methylase/superfamily II DNA or RNA helicase